MTIQLTRVQYVILEALLLHDDLIWHYGATEAAQDWFEIDSTATLPDDEAWDITGISQHDIMTLEDEGLIVNFDNDYDEEGNIDCRYYSIAHEKQARDRTHLLMELYLVATETE